MTVRCILIASVVILQLSATVKCDNVENGDEEQILKNVNTKYQQFPQTIWNDNELKTTNPLYVSKVKETDIDIKHEMFKQGCENSLCAFFRNHRVIRQAGYSQMYPQLPTSHPYQQPNNTYSGHQPSNNFGTYPQYPKPVVPITPYQNPTTNRPTSNSSLSNLPNNNFSHYNSANSQHSRHTYPPSPRPPNQPLPNYRANPTSINSNNINRPSNSFGNVSKPGYPSTYPRSNFTNYYANNNNNNNNYPSQLPNNHQRIPNTYPQPNPSWSGQLKNNSRPNYNGFNTFPTSNFNKNFNGYQIPNSSYYNRNNGSNNNYYNSQPSHTYGTPTVPNHRNYTGNSAYGNHFNNLYGGNNYDTTSNNGYTNNQSPHNPYQMPNTNKPQAPYNTNMPQYNPSMEPNHFYYVPNNSSSSQFDPRKHAPERFSY